MEGCIAFETSEAYVNIVLKDLITRSRSNDQELLGGILLRFKSHRALKALVRVKIV